MKNRNKKRKAGPTCIGKILLWFLLDNEDYSEVVSDFEEAYLDRCAEKGIFRALLWYWIILFKSIPIFIFEKIYWRIAMFKNYVHIAIRNILKYKGYAIINIFGLSIGIACSLFIFLWVQDELNFDRFHEKFDNLYRAVMQHQFSRGDVLTTIWSSPPLAAALKEEVPEILNATRYISETRNYRIAYGSTYFTEKRLSLADPTFLDMFTFNFIQGDPSMALSDPYSVVITEQMAAKYFEKADPIGKTLNIDLKYDFKVTGVIEDIPNHSHIQFDFLTPFHFIRDLRPNARLDVYWNNILNTYVLCRDNVALESLNLKIKGFIKAHHEDSYTDMFLQPLKHIHLYTLTGEAGALQYVRNFSIIAVFILLIACINFMNLSTARSARRAKEVGLRKVVGAERTQLVKQFLSESMFFTVIAICSAALLVKLLLPAFNQLCGKQMDLSLTWVRLLFLLSITVITGIVSGCYPAFYISGFRSSDVLRGSVGRGVKGAAFRKILVIFQFSLSIILIVCTMIVYRQLAFIQNKYLGLSREHILHMEIRTDFTNTYRELKNELSHHPNVLNITAANKIPTRVTSSTSGIGWDGKDPNDVINMVNMHVDFDFFKTFQMEMVSGRPFSKSFATDSMNYVLNEMGAQLMGKDEVVGERFNLWGREGKIVGVVKNFHFNHFSNEIEPLIITNIPRSFSTVIMRIRGNRMNQTIRDIESTWNRIRPEYPFEYRFFDQDFDQLYRTEQRMGRLFSYFTVLALLISCLGLLSLASFVTEQRTKEIGVRKVLGASVPGIIYLLSREFTQWVVLANVLAWPVSYLAMKQWLQNFAYRTDMVLWPFVVSACFTVGIALITVGYQSIRAALINPAESLKYE